MKKNTWKRIFACIIAFAMMFTMMPGNNLVSRAEEGDGGTSEGSTSDGEGNDGESRVGRFDVDYSPDSEAAVTCVLVDGNNNETPCALRGADDSHKEPSFVVDNETRTIKLTLTPPKETLGEPVNISVFVNGDDKTDGNLATNEGTTTWTYMPSAEEAASDDGLWIRVFWTHEEKEFDDFAPDENGYILEYHNPDRVAVTVDPVVEDAARKDREAYGITRVKFADTVDRVSFRLIPEDSNEKLTNIFYLGEEHPVDELSSDSEVKCTYDSDSNCYTVTFDIDKLNDQDGNEKIKWLDFMFEGEHWPGNNMFAVDYDTYNGTADVSCTVDGTDCPLRGENGEPKPYTFNKENGFKTIVLTLEPPTDTSGEEQSISVRVNEDENAGIFGTDSDGKTTWTYTPTSKEGLAIQVFWTEEEKQFNTFNPEYSQFMIQYSTSDNIEVEVTPAVSDKNKKERTAYGLTRVRFDKATEEVSFKLPFNPKQINVGETEYVLANGVLPAEYKISYSKADDSYILKIDTTNIKNAELVSLYFDFGGQENQIKITQHEQKITDLTSRELFKAAVIPGSAGIIWTSSDERVAKVDANGIVTPVANGVAMITAAMANDPNIKDSVAVEVAANIVWGIPAGKGVYYGEDGKAGGNLLLDTELPPKNDADITIDNNTFNFGTVCEVIKKTGDVSAVQNGADAKLSLYVTKLGDSMIPADDKGKIAAEIAKLPASAVTEIMTLDMSAFLTMAYATGKVTKVERLTDVETPIIAYVKLPESYLLKDTKAVTRHYFMVDMINGVATTKPLSIVFDTKLEITKSTFSTVCIGYYDTVNATSVTLDKTEATLTKAGETLQLQAAVLPEDAMEKGVTWASGNTNVATVDETGKVTAVANGEAIITVTSKANADLKKTCKVTVKIPVEPAKQDPKPEPTPTPEPAPTPDVTASYHTHIQTIGDAQGVKKNGEMAGTSGMAKRLENIWVKVEGNKNLGIQYSTHCQSYGWLPWSANGELNGTSGEAKRLEAIKIRLTGADASKYDVYYRVHAQSYGWLAWASNGAPAGTSGQAKRLEGIQIVVVKKGEQAPGLKYAGVDASSYAKNTSAFVGQAAAINIPGSETTPNVMYKTHVQTFGWQNWMLNGQVSGTSGKAKRLEGINIKLTNCDYAGGIRYSTHIQTYGWSQGWKENGAMAGTSGQAKRLEAIKIELTGEMAQHYDIYYRVHAQSYGWLNWASNGAPAGTSGMGKRLEAIQIVLVKKGESAPANNYQNVVTINNSAYIGR